MKKLKPYIINILLVIIIFTLSLIITDRTPFGNYSFVNHDAFSQYQPFLYDLIMTIRTGNFTLFRFSSMFGNPIFLSYMYYLSSPLNLIALVTENPYIMYYLVMLIKLILASICGTFYFNKRYNDSKISTICTISYIFSSWFLAYYFSILWLDIFAILPLIQYSLERMLKEKNIILTYIFTLSYCILSNFHLSIYICFYILFYFIIYHLTHKSTLKEKIYSLEKMIISTILSFSLILFFLYPVLVSFTSKIGFGQLYKLYPYEANLNVISSIIPNNSHVNLPGFGKYIISNIGISMFMFINIIYYFLNKDIKTKSKIKGLLIIITGISCFFFTIFTYIISGFYLPICFNYRYTFIISFLLIIFAIDNYIKIKEYNKKRYLITTLIILILLLISKIFYNLKTSIFILDILLLITYSIVILFKNNKKYIISLLFIETLLAFSFSTKSLIKANDIQYNYDLNNNHMSISDKAIGYDNLEYYTNGTSITVFSSTNYGRVLNFLGSQGYETDGKHILYNYNNDDLFRTLFNIDTKYKLEKIYSINKDILKFKTDYDDYDYLSKHENIANLMTGYNYKYFDEYIFKEKEYKDHIYTYEVEKEGFYTFLNGDYSKIILDNKIYDFVDNLEYIEDYLSNREIYELKYSQIISEYFNKGDIIRIIYKDNKEPILRSYITNENYPKVYNKLKENEIVYETFKDDYIDGYINVDDNELIFTLLPYDKDWEIYLDNKKVEPIIIMDTFIGIESSPGKHRITLKYKYHHHKSLLVSMVTLCILLSYYLYKKEK